MSSTTDAFLPLTGMTVIEISSYVAAPLAGMTLGQLGAQVIRIEPLGGQVDRSRLPLAPDGTSLYWSGLNQGKQSVAVDLRSAEGRALVAELIIDAGIVITNAASKAPLDYESLLRSRPDLIYVQLEGHRDGRTAIDYTIQAEVGIHEISGPEHHAGPVNQVLPTWDIASGLYIAIGVLAAERRRSQTGLGQYISVALHDVALATLGNLGYVADVEVNDASRVRDGNYVFGTFGRDFTSSDGLGFMLVVLTERHWRDLLAATDLDDPIATLERSWGVDLRSEAARYQYRAPIAALVEAWFRSHTAEEIRRILGSRSVILSEFTPLRQAILEAIGHDPLFDLIESPGIGLHHAARSPLQLADFDIPAVPAPRVGEHTQSLLARNGYSPDGIRVLRDTGTI